ncbi:glycosyl hydrolase [Fibrella sp. WM1]|uniref:glycosyl hydrolase n=1 Tax=Fibrella musci TaxID=3242485 RepID=UPI003522C7D6
MKRTQFAIACCLLLISLVALGQSKSNTVKPWTYWWWMGSAVTEADITQQLELMAKAGLGGVHVIPIYGVKGAEKQAIPFLSERWLSVFAHTIQEANRLGMGVDLTTGTGWPFGGPNVAPDMAAQQWKQERGKLVGVPTRQRVKRAAPGGEGLVVDPFERQHLLRYLARFDSALARLPQRPRALYNDSYEVYGANWTTRFPEQFRQRRGYELLTRIPDFIDTTNVPSAVAVRRDYHETLADLLRDEFTAVWTNWARQRGYQTRNQAHGSPGNLLDLYALADIPETESFGSSRFPIPGLRVDENYEVDRFGTPHPLAMKFASSAAHLLGKPLVSSETTTWLADHFKVSLSQIKPQIDELFTAGINHIFYHGTTYSPASQAWPGQAWPGQLFYASTNYGPSSHNWPFLPLLNQYVTRCQTRLQGSRPDNDLLVYFPIHDLWANRSPSAGGVHLLEVHHVDRWLLPMPFGRFCDSLRVAGYSFDYVSDALLDSLTVGPGGQLKMPGGTYKVLTIPPAQFLPERTRQRLAQLAAQGARIVYNANLTTLGTLPVRREGWAAQGLSFIRKKVGSATTRYFVANLGNQFREGWVRLSANGQVIRYDPLTDQTTYPARQLTTPTAAVWLRLLPGQSCFLTVTATPTVRKQVLSNPQSGGAAFTLNQPWQVQFGKGVPALRSTHTQSTLASWTTLSDSAGYFWGQVRYTTTFDLPQGWQPGQAQRLNLGDVREVAEVRINGRSIGTAWCLPYELTIPAGLLKARGNQLDIDVTNLSANYMRLRDGQKPDWKIFNDINIVDIRYRPFDATRWQPVPSGLLGPVRVER